MQAGLPIKGEHQLAFDEPIKAGPVEVGDELPDQRGDIGILATASDSPRHGVGCCADSNRASPWAASGRVRIRTCSAACNLITRCRKARKALFRHHAHPQRILIALLVILILLAIAAWWILRATRRRAFDQVTGPTDAGRAGSQTIRRSRSPSGRWKAGRHQSAKGLTVTRFAEGLEHPRTMLALPTATSSSPKPMRPSELSQGRRITNFIAGILFAQAGAAAPSPNKLILLQDKDGDGVAETRRCCAATSIRPRVSPGATASSTSPITTKWSSSTTNWAPPHLPAHPGS